MHSIAYYQAVHQNVYPAAANDTLQIGWGMTRFYSLFIVWLASEEGDEWLCVCVGREREGDLLHHHRVQSLVTLTRWRAMITIPRAK